MERTAKWKKSIDRIDNFYKSYVDYYRMSDETKELLEANNYYKDKYRGKRCFIFGNGPSINTLDFGLFKNEVVFTVNELFRHKDFELLNSNFHFIADPAYFNLKRNRQSDLNIINLVCELGKRSRKPEFFLPIESRKTVHRYGWDRKLDIHYFKSDLSFYDDYLEKMNFARVVPRFQAVVQWCIAFAVFAGFKEIYLLGCDATNILTDISLVCNETVGLQYAYDLSNEEEADVKRKHRVSGLEYTLYGYHKIVHLFSELNKYCISKGVKLYNCSSETVLDCIPRREISDVIKNSEV